MSSRVARRQELDRLFEEALELPPAGRPAFVESCPEDLREELARLLRHVQEETRGDSMMRELASRVRSAAERELSDGSSAGDGADVGAAGALFAPRPLVAGTAIGAYRLVGELGRGGMGEVYEAERIDGAYDQRVAIKLLRAERASPTLHARFVRERQILANLEHPNIARILDGGVTEDGRPFFVMEKVQGERIDRFCDSRQLPLRDRLRLFATVARAVQAAHRNLVIHRDLKPSNILVTEDREVKLLDFGIAKPLDEETMPDLTHTLDRVLTPEYASPEQIRGENVTTASDVYQLGLLLYELLTGNKAHQLEQRTPAAIERAVCSTESLSPSAALRRDEGAAEISESRGTTPRSLRRALRGDLDRVVLKAIEKEPERRYESAEQLAADVDRYLSGEPVLARDGGRWYHARRFVRRHRLAVSVGSLVGLILVVATALLAVQNLRIQRERDRARVEATKAREVRDFLARIFQEADPYESDGDPLSVEEILEAGATRLEGDPEVDPEIAAEMMAVVGSILHDRGDYERAERLLRESLRLRESLPSGDPLAVAESLRLLSSVVGERERREEGVELVERALAIYESQSKHAELPEWARDDWAQAINGLASQRLRQGEEEEAAELFRRALAMRIELDGEESLAAAAQLNNLAVALERLGDVDGAEELHRRSLDLRRRLAPESSSLVSESLNNLAVLMRRRGRYEEAEPLLREALEERRRVFGDHLRTANTANNLANTLLQLGRLDEAEALHREALALRRQILGESHSNVAMSLRGLGLIRRRQGDLEGAVELFRSAYEMFAATLGPEHSVTVNARQMLGKALCEARDPAAGIVHLEQAVRRQVAELGPDAEGTVDWRLDLGTCLSAAGQPERARDELLTARRILNAIDGDDDPRLERVETALSALE